MTTVWLMTKNNNTCASWQTQLSVRDLLVNGVNLVKSLTFMRIVWRPISRMSDPSPRLQFKWFKIDQVVFFCHSKAYFWFYAPPIAFQNRARYPHSVGHWCIFEVSEFKHQPNEFRPTETDMSVAKKNIFEVDFQFPLNLASFSCIFILLLQFYLFCREF